MVILQASKSTTPRTGNISSMDILLLCTVMRPSRLRKFQTYDTIGAPDFVLFVMLHSELIIGVGCFYSGNSKRNRNKVFRTLFSKCIPGEGKIDDKFIYVIYAGFRSAMTYFRCLV